MSKLIFATFVLILSITLPLSTVTAPTTAPVEIVESSMVVTVESEPEATMARSSSDQFLFTATAYDLSVASCGKSKSSPGYGVTASGFDLSNLSRTEAMTIAVDPDIIPLGSIVRIECEDSKYDGVYTARDIGSAIKGNKLDIFIPDGDEAIEFGVQKVYVEIIDG